MSTPPKPGLPEAALPETAIAPERTQLDVMRSPDVGMPESRIAEPRIAEPRMPNSLLNDPLFAQLMTGARTTGPVIRDADGAAVSVGPPLSPSPVQDSLFSILKLPRGAPSPALLLGAPGTSEFGSPGTCEPGLTLDRVAFDYNQEPILTDLSWELDKGASAVITGRNGCGKSSLLYVAAGLLPPRRGTVLHAGHPVANLLPSARVQRGLRVGFVFQEGGLLANLDALSNVSLALRYHYDILGLDEAALAERAEEALDAAQVARSDWDRLPAHLSFGSRKRLAMARALAMRPNFFFFDDPDVGLDPRTAQVTHHILCMLRDDPEVTLVVATNRSQLIERLEVSGWRLEDGRLSTHSGKSSLLPTLPRTRVS